MIVPISASSLSNPFLCYWTFMRLVILKTKRLIGRGATIEWRPRTPDFNSLAFFLRDRINNLIYETPIETNENLFLRVVVVAWQIERKDTICDGVSWCSPRRTGIVVDRNANHSSKKAKTDTSSCENKSACEK